MRLSSRLQSTRDTLLKAVEFSARYHNAPFLLTDADLRPSHGRILLDSGVFKAVPAKSYSHECLSYHMDCDKAEALRRVAAYLKRRAEKQSEAKRAKREQEKTVNKQETSLRQAARAAIEDTRNIVRLTDHRHWPHGNLSGVRSSSSLGGNSFAYHG